MAYDATQAIIQGLNHSTSPSRDNLKQALRNLQFLGATGQVKFLKNGDRQVTRISHKKCDRQPQKPYRMGV